MRAFVIALLLVLTSVPALQAQIDASCLRIARWGERGTTRSLEAEGTRFWAADGRGIATYDVAGDGIRLRSSIRTLAPSVDLELIEGALVVLTRDGIELWSRDANGPVALIDSVQTAADLITASGNKVVIAQEQKLELYEVGAQGFIIQSSLPLSRPASAIALEGNTLFVSTPPLGTFEYSVANRSFEPIGSHAALGVDIAITPDTVFFATEDRGLLALDRATGTVSSFFDDRTHSIDRLSIVDGHLVAADGDRLIWIDATDPHNLTIAAQTDHSTQALAAGGDFVCGAGYSTNRGYYTETEETLRCWNREGNLLRSLGSIGELAGPVGGVALSMPWAFVADPPMLRVLDLSDPSRPVEVAAVDYGTSDERLRLRDNLLLVYGRGNVHLFDVTNPRSPLYRGTHRTNGIPPSRADFSGAFVVEANRATGIHLMDPYGPSWPTQIGGHQHPNAGQVYGAIGNGSWIYVLVPRGILAMDITNPRKMIQGTFYLMSEPTDGLILEATGTAPRLLLISHANTLRVMDASNPATPVEIGSLTIGEGSFLSGSGSIVWASSPLGRVDRIDLSNPVNPRITHTITGLLEPGQTATAPGLLLVADRWGLEILRDPALGITAPSVLSHKLSPNERTATVRWLGGTAPWTIQVAGDESFANATTFTTGATSFTVPLGSASWVRVGSGGGCGETLWSLPVRIDRASGVRFSGGDVSIVVTESEFPLELSLPVHNPSETAAPLTIEALPPGVSAVHPDSVSAGANAAIDLKIEAYAPRQFKLRLGGTGSEVSTRISSVTPEASSAVAGPDLILPGVAAAPGARGTRWETDVHLYCISGQCDPRLIFVPARTDLEPRSVVVPLSAAESLRLDRVVSSTFGYTEATGHIRVHSSGELDAWATTWNDSADGRFGQRIPGWRGDEPNGVRWLPGLRHDSSYRTNLGLVETAGQERTVALTIFDANGIEGASVTIVLRPWEASQQPVDALFGTVPAGSVVRVTGPSDVIAWVSRVDQKTGDAAFSYAASVETGEREIWEYGVDVAGSAPGAEGSNWKTAMTLMNPSGEDALVRLIFLGGESETASISIAAGASFVAEDLFGDLFPHLGSVTGPMRILSSTPLAGSVRVYNDVASGTWGQSVPLRSLQHRERTTPGEIFLVGGAEDQRINLGLVETAGVAADVEIRVLDQGGNFLSSLGVRLEPLGSFTLLGALDALGVAGPVRIQIVAPAGIHAWASVVEDRTGDAIFIEGR